MTRFRSKHGMSIREGGPRDERVGNLVVLFDQLTRTDPIGIVEPWLLGHHWGWRPVGPHYRDRRGVRWGGGAWHWIYPKFGSLSEAQERFERYPMPAAQVLAYAEFEYRRALREAIAAGERRLAAKIDRSWFGRSWSRIRPSPAG